MDRYPSSEEILDFLVKGTLIAIAWTSPCAGAIIAKHLIFKAFDKAWDIYDQRRLKANIKRMLV